MLDNILPFKPRGRDHQFPQKLSGLNVAILACSGFNQTHLFESKEALQDQGANVEIVSLDTNRIKSEHQSGWGRTVSINWAIEEVTSNEYNVAILPGGILNTDKLRTSYDAIHFMKGFFKSNKPIIALGHGSQILIETRMLKGRSITSAPSLRTDLSNAGAKWLDKEIVIDQNLLSCHRHTDISSFNKTMIKFLTDTQKKSSLPSVEGYSIIF